MISGICIIMKDNKETNLRLFKLKLAHVFNDVVGLTDKLINVTSKKDNQALIDNIEIKKDKTR